MEWEKIKKVLAVKGASRSFICSIKLEFKKNACQQICSETWASFTDNKGNIVFG